MYTPVRRTITPISSFVILLLLASCSQKPASANKVPTDTLKVAAASDTAIDFDKLSVSDTGSQNAPYYIVEVATGHNFDSLKSISSNAVTILSSKFSMLDRIYKSGKGIVVPDNSDDEIYRGEYYPRRPYHEGNFVSIEMSNEFDDENADKLKMVAVAGMYAEQKAADSVAALLKNKIPTTKIVKQDVYMGCMH
ncbi:hypothetical protein A3860_26355 [Niastella vici]|uniref:Uncharacterized protein n=1 Tax=Niastella vici TaxID=1703345 RepID=A0A1V9FWX7_9BACT|nr:hypothetical protein [Niastella vici]OQP62837.1 hypothetical protein A3860_26355 [Niastella vici]